MSDTREALRRVCADIGAVSALLGFDDYPGVFALLRKITDLITREAATVPPIDLIIRDVCESDAADPNAANSICIEVDDLRLILENRLGAELAAAPAYPATLKASNDKGDSDISGIQLAASVQSAEWLAEADQLIMRLCDTVYTWARGPKYYERELANRNASNAACDVLKAHLRKHVAAAPASCTDESPAAKRYFHPSCSVFEDMLRSLQHVEAVYRLNVVGDSGDPSSTLDNLQRVIARATADFLPRADESQSHTDDLAVDTFARVMKGKLATAREKGRGGWEQCSPVDLSRFLREHVEKGDPRDVANFCMMLWHLGAQIAPLPRASDAESTGICFFCSMPINGVHETDCPQAAQPVADDTWATAVQPVRYFVYDNECGYEEFATDDERDKAHRAAIEGYLDDGWSEGVESVVSGIVTHKTTQTNLENEPSPCAAHPDHDDDACEACVAWGEWPNHDFETSCQYEPERIDRADDTGVVKTGEAT
ncbi:hypothetical protein [Paraburkholderia bryophila]|uniref:Uncharacterized protein n=1 Tax=Paraburkholderia bryophila TaxID=420952 RepID=A0A7Y9WID7_9BURK|nr:hypothetical protein [Paraburkholderia bryophila]NYH21429.1 hypothetical protein [Paraburkholderia bryophila]